MKRLIMCEGSNELAVVNILLENDALIFTEDDLLGLETMFGSVGSATSRLTGL